VENSLKGNTPESETGSLGRPQLRCFSHARLGVPFNTDAHVRKRCYGEVDTLAAYVDEGDVAVAPDLPAPAGLELL